MSRVGEHVRTRWADGTVHDAEILEERSSKRGFGQEYYVHYRACEYLTLAPARAARGEGRT